MFYRLHLKTWDLTKTCRSDRDTRVISLLVVQVTKPLMEVSWLDGFLHCTREAFWTGTLQTPRLKSRTRPE